MSLNEQRAENKTFYNMRPGFLAGMEHFKVKIVLGCLTYMLVNLIVFAIIGIISLIKHLL
jgi:hypothetical protein